MMGRNNEKAREGASMLIKAIMGAIVVFMVISAMPMTAMAQETPEERIERLRTEFDRASAAVKTATTARDEARSEHNAGRIELNAGRMSQEDFRALQRAHTDAQTALRLAIADCDRARTALRQAEHALCGPECQRQRRLRQQRRQQAEERTEEVCDNGQDDDGDGHVDCDDPDCADHESCQADEEEEEPSREICDNGVDDDGDGDVDCDDSECAGLREYCEPPEDDDDDESWCARNPGPCAAIIISSVLVAGGTAFGLACGLDDDHCGMSSERTSVNIRAR